MAEAQVTAQKIDPERLVEALANAVGTFMKDVGAEDNPILQNMMEGLTGAQAMGLDRGDLDALYTVFFQRLNTGDHVAARDGFAYLVMIDPLHAPNHYCLGVAWQAMGRMADAEPQFVTFLALDATNPVGYLRLGECYQHRGATDLAREAFELAEAECLNGHGDAITLAEARAKLVLLNKDIRK